jgi:hypothetical protein
MSLGDRTGAMADRLARAARDAGLADDAADIVATFRTVLDARSDIRDPDHHAWLHPARNALILMEDIGVRDSAELRASICFDGTRPAVPSGDPAVDRLLGAVPRAGERLLEDLVTAAEAPRRIALADRLDHARHLHLHLQASESWTAFHRETHEVWLPVAERTHEVFARRFRWWTRMFERRWLPKVRP